MFSDAPDALYILADVNSEMSPARRNYNSEDQTGLTRENLFTKYPELDGAMLVWFEPNWRDYLFSLEDLKATCDLQELEVFRDGAIYRIRRRM